MENLLTEAIEKFTGITELPTEEKIKEDILLLDKNINNVLKDNCKDSELISSLYKKLRMLDDIFTLRKRINSGISTVIYFIYTIAGSIVGISLAAGVFFTTTGNFGHFLLLLSILGSIVSIAIGIKSINDERKYLLYLVENIKGKV